MKRLLEDLVADKLLNGAMVLMQFAQLQWKRKRSAVPPAVQVGSQKKTLKEMLLVEYLKCPLNHYESCGSHTCMISDNKIAYCPQYDL